MNDASIKPLKGLKTHPEANFRVPSPWQAVPGFEEGAEYRLIDAPGTFNPVPTIAITASPASNAFWALVAAAADGKVRLRHERPSPLPNSPQSTWERLQAMGSALVAGASIMIRNIIPNLEWHVRGEGPWQYAKYGTFNESLWLGQSGIDAVRGSLVEVRAKPIGRPCGQLEFNEFGRASRIALPSGIGADYVYFSRSPDHRVLYDSDTRQYYLEATSGAIHIWDGVDVYRRSDVQFETPLRDAGFKNTAAAFVKAHQLSDFTRKVFETARQMERPEDQGGKGLSEADALQWAARQLSRSWTYEESTTRRIRIMTNGEESYKQFHSPDGIHSAECDTASTEFFHAARAYGYNVRLVHGYRRPADCNEGKNICHFSSGFTHGWVEYSDAAGTVHLLEATPGQSSLDPAKEQELDQLGNIGLASLDDKDLIIQKVWHQLLVPESMENDSQIILMDTIKPILEAQHDRSLMGDIQPVTLTPPFPEFKDVFIYPRSTWNTLPTRLIQTIPQEHFASTVYQPLASGDKIYWSPALAQFVLKTDFPDTPRLLRIYTYSCISDAEMTLDVCKKHPIPADRVRTAPPGKIHPHLQKLFEEASRLQDRPYAHTALHPADALRYIYAQFSDTLTSSFSADGPEDTLMDITDEDLNTLLKGLAQPPEETYRNYLYQDCRKVISFFRAARAYGYSVSLVVSSHAGVGFNLELLLRDPSGSFPLIGERRHIGGLSSLQRAQIHWAERPSMEIDSFFLAIEGQQRKSDPDVLQEISDLGRNTPSRAVIQYRRHLREITPHDIPNHHLRIHPAATNYQLPDSLPPPAEPPPMEGSSVDMGLDAITLAGRQIPIVSSLPRIDDPDDPEGRLYNRYRMDRRAGFQNTAGKALSIEDLPQVTFQLVRVKGGDGTFYDNVYYSPDLDLAITTNMIGDYVFKNSQGDHMNLQWQLPSGAKINRLQPVLRADLAGIETAIPPKGSWAIYKERSRIPSHAYIHALSPALDRILVLVRQEGGLHSPLTNLERDWVVKLYPQLIQNGSLQHGINQLDLSYSDISSPFAVNWILQKAHHHATTVASMIYVLAEYQKLWEDYQGQFPDDWTGSYCTPVERDQMPSGEKTCLPAEAPSPDSVAHHEWRTQLAREAKALKDLPGLPVDIQKLLEDAAQLLPD